MSPCGGWGVERREREPVANLGKELVIQASEPSSARQTFNNKLLCQQVAEPSTVHPHGQMSEEGDERENTVASGRQSYKGAFPVLHTLRWFYVIL